MSIGGAENINYQQPGDFVICLLNAAGLDHIKGVEEGRVKTRLKLTDKSICNIAVKLIGESENSGKSQSYNPIHRARYVRFKQGELSYDVNIRSAAKRLGISHKEVRELAKGENCLTELIRRAEIRGNAVEKYLNVIEKYTIENGELVSKKTGDKTGLKTNTLLKIIQKHQEIGGPLAEKIDNQMVRVSAEGKISVLKKLIGKDGLHKLYEAFNIDEDKKEIIKETIPGNVDAIKNTQKEINTLGEIIGAGHEPSVGIQSVPKDLTIVGKGKNQRAFYRTDFVSGSLQAKSPQMRRFHELKGEKKVEICRQLVDGLNSVHEKGYSHGTISPKNCLIKETENGGLRFELAGFSDATKGDEKTGHIPAYRPHDYDPSDPSIEELKKADVFALSLTLIQVLSGGKRPSLQIKDKVLPGKLLERYPMPVEFDSTTAANIRKNLGDRGIPKGEIKLLIRGLGPKDQRPTVKELFLNFNMEGGFHNIAL